MKIALTIMVWNLVVLLTMMFIGWLVSLVFRNVTIVDTLWGLGFVLVVWITFSITGGYPARKILMTVLTTLWGLRLAAHLSWRNWGAGFDFIGLAVWLLGFFFEPVSDFQLARFKADPNNKSKVMNQGLWAYSRHPNYFGESLIWWGIFLIALATPNSWWTVISPLVITVVLLKMTGIPLTEETITSRRPEYKDDIKHTKCSRSPS